MPEPFTDTTANEVPVRGFLHRADSASDALVLTHGAGGNCNAALLVALAERFSRSGVSVLRCDLPFRQLRPHGAPSPHAAQRDRDGLRRAITLLRQAGYRRLFVGGQSYGGRQASMLAAEEPAIASGLLLLSYPLHPPGKSGQPRTQHFPAIQIPALFVSGTADPFGSIDELEEAMKLLPAPARLLQIPKAGHALLTKSNRAELPDQIVAAFNDFFRVGTK
jgi:predicted alpha/beta-hydrolase family hydrolase